MYISATTDKGLVRPNNEDSYEVLSVAEDFNFIIVCDGVGGEAAGEVASETAVRVAVDGVRLAYRPELTDGDIYRLMDNTFSRINSAILSMAEEKEERRTMCTTAVMAICVGNTVYIGSVGRLMDNTFSRINSAILSMAEEKEERRTMCTTAVMAICVGNTVYIGSVGDSRAYVYSGGSFELLTRDHTVSQQLLDAGCITEDEAEKHAERHKLTQVIGIDCRTDPCYAEREFKPGDALLLCTDGLYDMLSNDKLLNAVDRAVSEKNVDVLIQEALAEGGADNITAVLGIF